MTSTSQLKGDGLSIAVPSQLTTPINTSISATGTVVEPSAVTTGWQSKPRRWMPRPDDPVNHSSRTLILCFDGTGDQFDDDNSNIVQIMAMLKKDDPEKQLVYYQPGIGTYTEGNQIGPGSRQVAKVLDQMFAFTLGSHVRQGYRFLMDNYTTGDKICLFGFSRGAYTARALAGMLQKVGLLPKCNEQQLPFAYLMYTREDEDALKLSQGFKQTFSIDVKIEFLGVFDTVASAGIVPRTLPFVGNNSCIRYFRHALALDEHRSKFMPAYYKLAHEPEDEMVREAEQHLREQTDATRVGSEDAGSSKPSANNTTRSRPGNERKPRSDVWIFENNVNKATGQTTDSLEVWFSGAHCDVGGGSVPNHTRHTLARIPLRWMIREIFELKVGIIFDADLLQDAGLDIDFDQLVLKPLPPRLSPTTLTAETLVPDEPVPNALLSGAVAIAKTVVSPITLVYKLLKHIVARRQPVADVVASDAPAAHTTTADQPFTGEALEELRDALMPAYDQLRLVRGWWVLEWLPLKTKREKAIYESTDRYVDYVYIMNRGAGRKVFKHIVSRGMKVHRSVLTRLEALDRAGKGNTYAPLIRPNIHVKNKGKDVRVCRRMTCKEWMTRSVEDKHVPQEHRWFEWEGSV